MIEFQAITAVLDGQAVYNPKIHTRDSMEFQSFVRDHVNDIVSITVHYTEDDLVPLIKTLVLTEAELLDDLRGKLGDVEDEFYGDKIR